jgi:hypothetical protein
MFFGSHYRHNKDADILRDFPNLSESETILVVLSDITGAGNILRVFSDMAGAVNIL